MGLDFQTRRLKQAEDHLVDILGPDPLHGAIEDIQANGAYLVLGARPGMTVSLFDLRAAGNGIPPSRTRPCVSLTFLTEAAGTGWLLDEDECRRGPIPLRENRLYVMIAPDGAAGVDDIAAGKRMRGIDVRLSLDLWQRMGGPGAGPGADHPWHLASAGTAWCGTVPLRAERVQALRDLCAAALTGDSSDLGVEASVLALVSDIVAVLNAQAADDTTSPRDRAAVGRACAAVREDLARAWRVADMARMAGTSEKRLKQIFPRVTGLSCYAWVQEERLLAAHRRVSEGDCTITELALDLGYSSSSHFTSQFRRRFGRPPSRVTASPADQPRRPIGG